MGWQWVGWFRVEELSPLERNGLIIRVLPATGITGIVLRKAPPKDAFGGTNGVIAMISTIRSRQFCVIEARTVGQEEFGR